jgi:hypothetical protein
MTNALNLVIVLLNQLLGSFGAEKRRFPYVVN